ncbi:hypothetical protein RA210_U120061 [Rubrivivax sp. A210]|nr:hypothetical protein RA210_U120061 [Rubrivivax sp. A210]
MPRPHEQQPEGASQRFNLALHWPKAHAIEGGRIMPACLSLRIIS